ncbi:hypothetical protein B0H19DRAFT_1085017 [Mycena capillaripes]|nr:hypothetical protein B0H19DRAFT_1085017 [Mycena capillaripes]
MSLIVPVTKSCRPLTGSGASGRRTAGGSLVVCAVEVDGKDARRDVAVVLESDSRTHVTNLRLQWALGAAWELCCEAGENSVRGSSAIAAVTSGFDEIDTFGDWQPGTRPSRNHLQARHRRRILLGLAQVKHGSRLSSTYPLKRRLGHALDRLAMELAYTLAVLLEKYVARSGYWGLQGPSAMLHPVVGPRRPARPMRRLRLCRLTQLLASANPAYVRTVDSSPHARYFVLRPVKRITAEATHFPLVHTKLPPRASPYLQGPRRALIDILQRNGPPINIAVRHLSAVACTGATALVFLDPLFYPLLPTSPASDACALALKCARFACDCSSACKALPSPSRELVYGVLEAA